jgi:hypothetical protein
VKEEKERAQSRDRKRIQKTQSQAEYNLAWKNQKPKKDESEIRLKLYNNQKRDKKAVWG